MVENFWLWNGSRAKGKCSWDKNVEPDELIYNKRLEWIYLRQSLGSNYWGEDDADSQKVVWSCEWKIKSLGDKRIKWMIVHLKGALGIPKPFGDIITKHLL